MTRKTQDLKTLTAAEIESGIENLKTYEDTQKFLKSLVAPVLQKLLNAELNQYLGYPKHHISGHGTGNSRNGYSSKTIKTIDGEVGLQIPRDRNGSFDPQAVRRYETRSRALDEQIVTLYAKGNSTRQIADFAHEVYGVNVSADMVSEITDKVLPLVEEWQNRPLNDCYPIVYLDGIHHKVRENGRIVSKCAYIIMGISLEGKKDVLGIWIGENESSKFWMGVLNEIRSRGVKDVLIACVDGLKGFSEAIKAIYPETEIQKCIVHQIRNTTKFIPHKHKKDFCKDLKCIYTAVTEEAGLKALQITKEKWKSYSIYLKSWEDNWPELSTFFTYPEEIRHIIYTTNAIENLNRQFRKITKTTTIFPHDTALRKLLWLAQEDITKKWHMPVRNWGSIAAQFAILFPDRFKL